MPCSSCIGNLVYIPEIGKTACKLRKETGEQKEEQPLVLSPEEFLSDYSSDSEKEEITMANN